MPYIYEVEMMDVISKLPNISLLQIDKEFWGNVKDDLFLCALGFEDRSTHIPRMLVENNEYKCDQTIYFEYATNLEDNEINREELMHALQNFSETTLSVQCDTDYFTTTFRQTILTLCQKCDCPKITFDISSCSSKLLLHVMKVLMDYNVELRIVYSEAAIYHPTIEETKNENLALDEIYLTEGASTVYPSREYPGNNIDALPEAIIAFATFNPDRTQVVISYIDENLLGKASDRVIWIIGRPHLDENQWRIDYLEKINNIPPTSQIYYLSTFDYKDTVKCLYKLYERHSMQYHLTISPLGSKMQSIGIALFHYMKPEISIMFAPPIRYNANKYSEGCKDIWKIDFGPLMKIKNLLDEIGIIKIKNMKVDI